jgi:hypothetical protein
VDGLTALNGISLNLPMSQLRTQAGPALATMNAQADRLAGLRWPTATTEHIRALKALVVKTQQDLANGSQAQFMQNLSMVNAAEAMVEADLNRGG